MSFKHVNPASIAKFNSALSLDFIESLENHIDDVIIKEDSKPKKETFAPSSFRCSRAMWFRLRSTQPGQTSKADRVLKFKAKLGNACHVMLQEYISDMLGEDWISVESYLKEHPIDYEYTLTPNGYETQVEATKPYPIRFAVDGVVRLKGKYYLLEIKSCEPDVLKELTDPMDKHIDQAKCYCTILGLDKVLFVYIDRTYGDMKCYEVNILQRDRDEVIQKFKDIMWAAEYDIAPEPLPKGDSWCTSSMCPYYSKCKEW